jgi:predicted nucleic acid-binding protein
LTVYADTSFFVSVYIADSHSASTDRWLASSPRIPLTPLHIAEWAHAVAQHVYRGQLSSSDANQVTREFETDQRAGLWMAVAMPENAFILCADIARRYGAKLGVRTLDSLHVACALELKAERFWTFDERQAKLALTVGLKTK